MRLRDPYGRPFKSFRVAVTYACNFNCFFCHREGIDGVKDELSWDEIALIAKAAIKVGAEDVKLTGGEPLVKQGIINLIRELRDSGFKDISLTTNGYLLSNFAARLKEAGISRVNVSLHTLKRERFMYITGIDGLQRVIEGIERAKDNSLNIFINVTVLRGVNDDEILDIINFAAERGLNVHLIELHPVGKAKDDEIFTKFHGFPEDIINKLEKKAVKIEIRRLHNRIRYIMEEGIVVEIVQPVGNPLFCAGCMRIRLSPDGKLYPCLNEYKHFVDVKNLVRSNLRHEDKMEKLIDAFIKVNKMRKPYYLWNINYEKNVLLKNFKEYLSLLNQGRLRRYRLDPYA